jgi:O-antigen/teichoic acid export membrane protein
VGWARPSIAAVRPLLRPALALVAGLGAQMVAIQGPLLAIGFVLGSAAVPVFTTLRTLSRVVVQAVMIVTHSVMPSFTAAMAVADAPKVARLAGISVGTALALAVPGALILLFAGQQLVGIWTGGALRPDFALVAIMAATVVLTALWLAVSNLILAINRHEGYAWWHLAAAITALLLSLPLLRWLGVEGAAWALLMLELAMLWRVASLARRLDLLDMSAAAKDIRRAMGRLRARRSE